MSLTNDFGQTLHAHIQHLPNDVNNESFLRRLSDEVDIISMYITTTMPIFQSVFENDILKRAVDTYTDSLETVDNIGIQIEGIRQITKRLVYALQPPIHILVPSSPTGAVSHYHWKTKNVADLFQATESALGTGCVTSVGFTDTRRALRRLVKASNQAEVNLFRAALIETAVAADGAVVLRAITD